MRRLGGALRKRSARPMRPTDIARELARFSPRRPGGDAERRAALWLAGEVRARGRAVQLETAWVRPQWALTYALHASLGIVASLLSVSQPEAGLSIAAVA